MMTLIGTIQTAVVAAFVLSWSSWELKWEGGLVLVTILLGVSHIYIYIYIHPKSNKFHLSNKPLIMCCELQGLVVTGLSYYVMMWSVKKKGPVFTSAFNPLLVVFSFSLQTFVMGYPAHLGRYVYIISSS